MKHRHFDPRGGLVVLCIVTLIPDIALMLTIGAGTPEPWQSVAILALLAPSVITGLGIMIVYTVGFLIDLAFPKNA